MLKKSEKKHKILIWASTFMWAMVVLFLSVIPGSDLPESAINHLDKGVHFFEYVIFAILIIKGLHAHCEGIFDGQTLLFTLIIAGLYGILMELCQFFVPGRDPSLGDVAANIGGVVFGMMIGKVMICRK
ncbi:MAG: VanZ family protein [Candidatus Omnitrophica bacterium]|nr:VanZ family protein [Candidatus Omnitrophota bacterium]